MEDQFTIFVLAATVTAIFGIVSLVIIRTIKKEAAKKEPKLPKKPIIGIVGMVRYWVGISAIIIAIAFFMSGNLALTIADYWRMDAKTTVDQDLKKYKEDKAVEQSTNGIAMWAVGFGLTFAAAQFIIDAFDIKKSGRQS